MIIELFLWSMLTTSIQTYAFCLEQVIYIQADQKKVYLILEEEP